MLLLSACSTQTTEKPEAPETEKPVVNQPTKPEEQPSEPAPSEEPLDETPKEEPLIDQETGLEVLKVVINSARGTSDNLFSLGEIHESLNVNPYLNESEKVMVYNNTNFVDLTQQQTRASVQITKEEFIAMIQPYLDSLNLKFEDGHYDDSIGGIMNVLFNDYTIGFTFDGIALNVALSNIKKIVEDTNIIPLEGYPEDVAPSQQHYAAIMEWYSKVFFNNQEFQIDITNLGYGDQVFSFAKAYPKGSTPKETFENQLNWTQLFFESNNNISFIHRINGKDNPIGEYPIISESEAVEIFREGKAFSCVKATNPEAEIVFTRLAYYDSPESNIVFSVYEFYVDVSDGINGVEFDITEPLYTVFYVPAIPSKLLDITYNQTIVY